AAGKPVDARSDIFAFGVVLYELLAGERPFTGKGDVDVMHAILHGAPRPLAEQRPDAPAEVRVAVEKALEKDPADRQQSMREMVVDLRRSQRLKTSEAQISAVAPKPRRPNWVIPAVSGAVALLALGVAAWLLDRSDFFWRNPLANAQFTRLTDFEGEECDADISSDGKFVVFLSDRDGPYDAWVHRLGTGEFVNLT